MRVHLSSVGCKLNQAELERLARELSAAGHQVVSSLAVADLHIVNSCTVTHVAARDSRKMVRRGRRLNARLKTVLTGCWVSAQPDEAAALAGVDLVVPNRDKERLLERLRTAFPEEIPDPGGAPSPDPLSSTKEGNARALVKVDDGCNMRCSFCVIPLTRGAQRSRALPEVVEEVGSLAAGGFREVVVTGVQISSYRWNGAGLYELVRALLEKTPVRRLRLSSIGPWELDERLLALTADGRLCRHFHLSLQSGSTATLQRMRRPYTAREFASVVGRIHRAVPGAAVTTDVIAGFPGETDEEFADSLAFVERLGLARIHAFPFSPRPGTEAAALPDRVPHEVKRERMAALLEVAKSSARRFAARRLGEEVEVLWERRTEQGWHGITDHYLRVVSPGDEPASGEDLVGRLTRARLEALIDHGVAARMTSLRDPLSTLPAPDLAGAAGPGSGRDVRGEAASATCPPR